MPGVDDKSVEITLEKNILTITGRVEPLQNNGHRLDYAEYDIGDYQRAFALSEEVARDGITATVKNGVLKLTLPKAPQARTRKIEVKGS